MDKKKILPKRKGGVLRTLLIIMVICIAIYWLFFTSLSWITKHDKEITVPNFIGMTYEEAIVHIKQQGYRMEIDSSYQPERKGKEILDQQPREGMKVKQGRTLFLTLNKSTAPEIDMPNLVNLSYRSAEMVLNSNKLILGDTIVKPDLADGAVIEMLYRGQPIKPNAKIQQGEKIDLIIGGGLKEILFEVPDLVGFTYDEVINLLSSYSLHANISYEGHVQDTFRVVVIAQNPKPFDMEGIPQMIKENQVIHIRMKDPVAGNVSPSENTQLPTRNDGQMNARPVNTNQEERQPAYQYKPRG